MTYIPQREDGYAAPVALELTREVWDGTFGDIDERLLAVEARAASFQALEDAGIGQVLETIQEVIEPQFASLAAASAAAQAQVNAAEAALAGILAGQLPASQVTLAAISGFAPSQVQNAIAVLALRALTAGTGLTGGGTLVADRSFAVDFATAAELRSGAANKSLTPAIIYAALAPVALTYGATVTPDFNAGRNFTLTLTGNPTIANPTNQAAGQSGLIRFQQDATGGRNPTWGTNWKFPGGAPLFSTAAGSIDIVSYQVFSAGEVIASASRDFKS